MVYSPATGTPGGRKESSLSIQTIILVMLGLIALSIFSEVLPKGFKDRAGKLVCWGMMFTTMSFLILSTFGLLAVIGIYTWRSFSS